MSYERRTDTPPDDSPYAPQVPTGMGLEDAAILDTRRIEEGYTLDYESIEDADLQLDKSKALRLADEKRYVSIRSDGMIKNFPMWRPLNKLVELGVGCGLFLRHVRDLGMVLIAMTLLTLPALIVYSQGNGIDNPSVFQKLSYGNNGDSPSPVLGVFDLFSAILFTWYLLYMRTRQQRTVIKIDYNTVTASDYSITVRNLPRHATDPVDIAHFFSRFGEVVSVGLSLNFGKLARRIEEKKQISRRIQEFEAAARLGKTITLSCWEKSEAWHRHRLSALESEIAHLKAQKYKCTGVAFITFMNEKSKIKAMQKLNKGSMSSWFRKFFGRKELNYLGVRPRAKEPAEPSDVEWENLEISYPARLLRIFLSFCASFVVIAICFVIILLVNIGREEQDSGSITLRVVAALIVTIANRLLRLILRKLSAFERLHTKTFRERFHMFKLIVAQTVNSCSILVMNNPSDDSFFVKTADQIFLIVAFNLIADILLQSAKTSIYQLLRSRAVRKSYTQASLERAYEYPEFSLAERYAFVVKSLFICMMFGNLYPVVLVVTSPIVIGSFLVDKYNLLHVYRKTPLFRESISTGAMHFSGLALLLRSTFTLMAYSGQKSDSTGYLVLVILSTVVAGFLAIMVWLPPCECTSGRLQRQRGPKRSGLPFVEHDIPIYQPPLLTSDVSTFNCKNPSQAQALSQKFAAMKDKASHMASSVAHSKPVEKMKKLLRFGKKKKEDDDGAHAAADPHGSAPPSHPHPYPPHHAASSHPPPAMDYGGSAYGGSSTPAAPPPYHPYPPQHPPSHVSTPPSSSNPYISDHSPYDTHVDSPGDTPKDSSNPYERSGYRPAGPM